MAERPELECKRLHAAYGEMRRAFTRPHFAAFMTALENDLRDDAFAFIPVEDENVGQMRAGGPIKWPVVQTPVGKMLAAFTSKDEVARHPAGNSVGVKLRAIVRQALADDEIAGVLFNVLDGKHGVPVEHNNLTIVSHRAGMSRSGMPQLKPGIVSDAVYKLWQIAVGVPTSVYDTSEQLNALGGLDKTLGPVLKKWSQTLESGSYTGKPTFNFVKDALTDVVSTGFVYGAMALKHPDKAFDADIERCIGAIPDLKDDIAQNVSEYLTLLSDAIRSDMIEPNEEQLQLLLLGNMGIIAFGAFNFGLGWGIAKDAESQGVMVLAELRDKQQAWLEDFKEKAIKYAQETQALKGRVNNENAK